MGLGQIGKLRLLRSENPTVLAARATALLWKATLVSNRSDAPFNMSISAISAKIDSL